MDVDLPWHLCRLLHVHIIVEEVLQGWHLSQWLKLVSVAFWLERGSLLNLRLRTNSNDTLDSLLLLLGIEGSLALIVPELPGCFATMPARRTSWAR